MRICSAPAKRDSLVADFAGPEHARRGDALAGGGLDPSAERARAFAVRAIAGLTQASYERFSGWDLRGLEWEDSDLDFGQPERPAARLKEVIQERVRARSELEGPGLVWAEARLGEKGPAAEAIGADAAQGTTRENRQGDGQVGEETGEGRTVFDSDPAQVEALGPVTDLRAEGREIESGPGGQARNPRQEALASGSRASTRPHSKPEPRRAVWARGEMGVSGARSEMGVSDARGVCWE